MSSTTKIMAKSFESPDEVRTFEKGKVEIVNLGNVIIGRATFEPGWSWGKCVKPLVQNRELSGSAYFSHNLWKNEN